MRSFLVVLGHLAAAPFLLVVRGYRRFISPWTPPTCRFSPTCSAYAEEALRTVPLPKALAKIAWRILRCQPLCRGGYDPVHKDNGHPGDPTPGE